MKRLEFGIWNLKFSRFVLRVALAVFAVAAFAIFTTEAWARVGGGHSYGGGGGSGGGGGDGGGLGVLVYLIFRFLLWLTIEHPAIGIPVDIIVIALLIYWFAKPSKKSVSIVSSSPVLGLSTGPGVRPQLDVQRAFNQLRRFDLPGIDDGRLGRILHAENVKPGRTPMGLVHEGPRGVLVDPEIAGTRRWDVKLDVHVAAALGTRDVDDVGPASADLLLLLTLRSGSGGARWGCWLLSLHDRSKDETEQGEQRVLHLSSEVAGAAD